MKYISIGLGRNDDEFAMMVMVSDEHAESLKQSLHAIHNETAEWDGWENENWDKCAQAEDKLIQQAIKKYGGVIIDAIEVIV